MHMAPTTTLSALLTQINVVATRAYLEACNLVFERGLLSKDCVTCMSSDVIRNINSSMEFFQSWAEETHATGKS